MRGFALMESGRRTRRRAGFGGVASTLLHLGAIALAVEATAGRGEVTAGPRQVRIHYASPPPERSVLRAAPAARSVSRPTRAALPPAAAVPTLNAIVPDGIPPIGETLVSPSEFARGLADVAAFEPGSPPLTGAGGAYNAHQVDEPAAYIGNQPAPRYPARLVQERVSGRVRVRFVVGAAGRAEGGAEILAATDSLFAASVREFVARARYRPARVGGNPVSQLVEQEFVFELDR